MNSTWVIGIASTYIPTADGSERYSSMRTAWLASFKNCARSPRECSSEKRGSSAAPRLTAIKDCGSSSIRSAA